MGLGVGIAAAGESAQGCPLAELGVGVLHTDPRRGLPPPCLAPGMLVTVARLAARYGRERQTCPWSSFTYQMVRAHIATLRRAPASAPPRPPTVRQVTGWLTRHPSALSEDDRAGLKDVLARCPELDTAAGHVRNFGEILIDRLGATLPAWIDSVDASQLPGLTGFALHLLRDIEAVTAGLTLDWSSGSIEGAVNRIKKIKRQLYGRAGFGLLRKLILLQ